MHVMWRSLWQHPDQAACDFACIAVRERHKLARLSI
jgi:hypothetical protein